MLLKNWIVIFLKWLIIIICISIFMMFYIKSVYLLNIMLKIFFVFYIYMLILLSRVFIYFLFKLKVDNF